MIGPSQARPGPTAEGSITPGQTRDLGTSEAEREERDSDRVTLTGTGNMTTEHTGKLANTALNETVE